MHGDVTRQVDVGIGIDEHADTRAVQIGCNDMIGFDALEATHLDVFTHLGNQGLSRLFDAAAIRQGHLRERLDGVGLLLENGFDDRVGEGLEIIVLGDEVGLGVDFEYYRRLAVIGNTHLDRAVGGNPPGFLVGLGRAGLAHQFGGGVDIATGFDQRFLAFHHARTGSFAQFLYQCCCNSHLFTSLGSAPWRASG